MTALERMRRRVKAIDPDLDLQWLAYEQKYAVVQKLENTPSVEEMTEIVGRDLQNTLLDRGYQMTLPECTALAYTRVAEHAIVFRLEDEDGNPRPLDDRAITQLREMAWNRRHMGVKEWQKQSNELQYAAQQAREKKIAAIWDSVRSDKVFARIASDVLWGVKPVRSINVPA
jgi:hypothetical protein